MAGHSFAPRSLPKWKLIKSNLVSEAFPGLFRKWAPSEWGVGAREENFHSGSGLDFSKHGDISVWKRKGLAQVYISASLMASLPQWGSLGILAWEQQQQNVFKEAKTASQCEIPWPTCLRLQGSLLLLTLSLQPLLVSSGSRHRGQLSCN